MTKQLQETKPKKLTNPKRELFCKLYATDFDFIGNGVKCYQRAYPDSSYAAARRSASALLTNPDILARINDYLSDGILSDEFVDTQLAFLLTQNADFSAKMQAIKEYNVLKKRTAGVGAPGQLNIIALILQKWGLDDVGQDSRDAIGVSENGTQP